MSSATQALDAATDDLERIVSSFVRARRIPGAAAGVVIGRELVWSVGSGSADIEAGRPTEPTDLYRIASITKTFTASAIMQLRDDGMLRLDDPVVEHLPELAEATNTFGPIEDVTLRRLLSHESGLMVDPPGTDWAARVYEGDVRLVLARAAEIAVRVPPTSQSKYSNLAFQLLGEVVTRRSGTPYADYVRANILGPLGMSSTTFDPVPRALLDRCATGYAPRTFSDRLAPARPLTPQSAEGGLWSSVDDLGRWIGAQFRTDGGDRGGDTILAGSTLREMHRPRYLVDDAWTEAYCIGWYARRRGDDVWIQHSGGHPGFITGICFHAQEQVGAVVLLNGIASASALAMDLGEIALGVTRRARPTVTTSPPVPEPFRSLLGLYTNDDLENPLRIEWREARLMIVRAEEPTWQEALAPTDDPSTFLIDPGPREAGEPVIVDATSDGRVRGVNFASEYLRRLDPVED